MGRGKGLLFALIVAIAPLAPYGCGEADASNQMAPTAQNNAGSPDGGSAGGIAGAGSAGTPGGGAGGVSGGGAGAPGGDVPTEPIDLDSTCSICTRAENCCKAEGLSGCNYGVECANATPAARSQFYLVLCRAVLEASRTGGKQAPDTCGF